MAAAKRSTTTKQATRARRAPAGQKRTRATTTSRGRATTRSSAKASTTRRAPRAKATTTGRTPRAKATTTTRARSRSTPRRPVRTQPKTIAERMAEGRALRQRVPRTAHGEFSPAANRPDPVDLLESQSKNRVQELIPVRYGRMIESPFAFYRGSAVDHGRGPGPHADDRHRRPGLRRRAPARTSGSSPRPSATSSFDLNDFDETLPGPWEWDVKRLAASFVLAGRASGFDATTSRRAATPRFAPTRAQHARVRARWATWTSGTRGSTSTMLDQSATAETSEAARARRREKARLARPPTGAGQARPRWSTACAASWTTHRYRAASPATGRRRTVIEATFARLPQDPAGRSPAAARPIPHPRRRPQGGRRGERWNAASSSSWRGATRATRCSSRSRRPMRRSSSRTSDRADTPTTAERVVERPALTQAASDIFLGWIRGRRSRAPDFYVRQLRT